jgi:hypothetical protein
MKLNTSSKEEKNYVEFCDTLLANWKENKITLEDNYGFDLNAMPEPYLTFGNGDSKVCFLTNNPGKVADFQKRNSNFSTDGESYTNLSKRLAKRYANQVRIKKMHEASNKLFPSSNGFTQFEISPFHSANFPNKNKFAKDILNAENNLHTEYIDKLTSFLNNKNCISIQAGKPLLERQDQPWLILVSKILGVKIEDWKLIVFGYSEKGAATSGVWYYKKNNFFKLITFMDSTTLIPKGFFNTLSKLEGPVEDITELFKILKSS